MLERPDGHLGLSMQDRVPHTSVENTEFKNSITVRCDETCNMSAGQRVDCHSHSDVRIKHHKLHLHVSAHEWHPNISLQLLNHHAVHNIVFDTINKGIPRNFWVWIQ